jgi:hypothetical protein
MIELLAFTKLLELGAQRCDHRSARAEDEFYRSFGTSRIERLAARLLAYRPTKKGRDVRDPSTLKTGGNANQAALRIRPWPAAGDASMRNCWISVMSASASLAN